MAKIQITIDTENQDEFVAFQRFLADLSGNIEVAGKAPKKVAKKAKAAKESKEAEAEAEESSEYSIEEVRVQLAKHVNDHRDAIKKKLTALGAKNVTSLEDAKYPEFMEFLEKLDK